MKSNNASFSENQGFSPVRLRDTLSASPSKNLTGPPRIARDIVADLFNNVQKWNSLHILGSQLVKQIASIKFSDPGYNKDLEDQVNQLYSVVQDIKAKKDIFETLIVQSEALSNLGKTSQPLFLSLSASQIGKIVNEVCCAYVKDFQMKEFVLQNIAHDKNLNNVMFLAACWTHQLDVSEEINFKLESLLVETNHRPIV